MIYAPLREPARDSKTPSAATKVSLSTYYPKNTQYFYGYPAGQDSGFLNEVPPEIEELVAMRANSCAGPNVSIIGFSGTSAPAIDQKLLKKLGVPQLEKKQLALLPTHITPHLTGAARNEAIKQALQRIALDHSLIMAQPYVSQRLAPRYQIDPEITTWLNDKQHIQDLISKEWAPELLASYSSGRDLAKHSQQLVLPCVIKATASSSGDGVYICKTAHDLARAIKALSRIDGAIIVEAYVEIVKNYGLHFGIPVNDQQSIDFIGINEQLTNPDGSFIGGIIRKTDFPRELLSTKHYLEYAVLPKVRSMGWYGVGCFDVLIDKNGKIYIIDGNFRLTGMSAYHFLVANNQLKPPLIGFSGVFHGNQAQFEAIILPLAKRNSSSKIIQIIAINHHENVWRFNAALLFENDAQLKQRCAQLESSGIISDTLAKFA